MGSSHHPATTTADRQRLSEPHEAREPAVRSHPNGRPDGEATRQDNTTATADTSTGSTRKEHGASYPRPLPRSLCGVRCLLQRTAREGSDVDAGRCGTERREAPGHARSPLVLRRQETPVRYCTATWLTALECWSTWWLGNQACSGVQIWEIQQRGSRATRRALWRRQHDSTGIGGVGIPRFQHDPRHGPVLSHARPGRAREAAR